MLLACTLDDAVCQTHQALHLGGDDDLGGLTVGDVLHGLDGLELQDAVGRGGLVQHLQGVGQCLLDLTDGLGLTGGLQDGGLLLSLGLQNGGFLLGRGAQDGGLDRKSVV